MELSTKTQPATDFGRFGLRLYGRELLADNRPVKPGGRAFEKLMVMIEARGTVGIYVSVDCPPF
jgi:hypothetical protein